MRREWSRCSYGRALSTDTTSSEVDAGGDVAMGPEITDFKWWNRRECLPRHSHVEAILERLCGLPTPIRDGAEQ